MSENKSNICPCCPKGCDLSAPRCSRGEEYLRTGIIPEKNSRGHQKEEHNHEAHQHGEHCHGEHCHREHRPNYEEMGIDEKLFALLNRLGRAGHGTSDGKGTQHRILQILSKTESITQRELTQQLGIQPGSASEIIKKLESAGLITRQSNSEDRRTVDITLTDAGRAQADAASAQHTNHAPFESLTDEEKQQLLTLLEKLGQDWHRRFRGEGRCEHKHHGEGACNRKQGHGCKHHNDQECRHGDKHGHDSDHNHGHKHGRREGREPT